MAKLCPRRGVRWLSDRCCPDTALIGPYSYPVPNHPRTRLRQYHIPTTIAREVASYLPDTRPNCWGILWPYCPGTWNVTVLSRAWCWYYQRHISACNLRTFGDPHVLWKMEEHMHTRSYLYQGQDNDRGSWVTLSQLLLPEAMNAKRYYIWRNLADDKTRNITIYWRSTRGFGLTTVFQWRSYVFYSGTKDATMNWRRCPETRQRIVYYNYLRGVLRGHKRPIYWYLATASMDVRKERS